MRRLSHNQLTDDLFDRSTMSFGEHLEELRRTIMRASMWLGLGTLVGLLLANSIILAIKAPLLSAIRDAQLKHAQAEFLRANGYDMPDSISQLMQAHGVLPEIVYEQPLAGDTASFELPLVDLPVDPWEVLDAEAVGRLRPRVDWRRIQPRVVALSSTEPFSVWFKAAVAAGFVFGSPGIFWSFWQFLAAGLYPHERRQVMWYLPISLSLFLSGVSLAFFLLLRLILGYLIQYAFDLQVEFTPQLSEYITFALLLPIGFGLAFQLPIAMLGLNRFGIVSISDYMANWRMAVLVIAFISMVLTPQEVYSMLGMFLPLTALYFLGIALCRTMPGKP